MGRFFKMKSSIESLKCHVRLPGEFRDTRQMYLISHLNYFWLMNLELLLIRYVGTLLIHRHFRCEAKSLKLIYVFFATLW